MNSTEILDRVFGILKQHFGEQGARNICVGVHDEAVFYAASDARPGGRVLADIRISVCEEICDPPLEADIADVRGTDCESVLDDFERIVVPQIKRAWKGAHCGFDPVLLGC